MNEETEIEDRKFAHLQITNSKIPQYNLDFVMNSDYSGFSKEYFSKSTISRTSTRSYQGEKDSLQLVRTSAK